MRPEILYPLFAAITTLKGVGPRTASAISKAMGRAGGKEGKNGGDGEDEAAHAVDLLWHLPTGLVDRRYNPSINEAEAGRVATLLVTVDKHEKPHNKRQPYKVRVSDDSGKMELVFFHAHSDYLKKTLPEGELRAISGLVEHYNDRIQMTHPDHMVKAQDIESILTVEPLYGLSAGVSQKVMARAVHGALAGAPTLDEWLDAGLKQKHHWPDWHQAIDAVHNPGGLEDLEPSSGPRSRLAYDELLANQLALGLVRKGMRRAKGRVLTSNGHLRQKVLAALPFDFTASQKTALAEIDADLNSDVRMLRLLQGDVGSGKTVVALMAMLSAVEAGAQAVLMAPTDVLARQHLKTLEPLARACGINVVVLTGREKGKAREAILAGLASGEIHLALGTHALFQDDVVFEDLRVCIIDEQHRFGVHQRLELAKKGSGVDVLVMTATPIPRTLMLTAYGDMDVSRLLEKPAGRKPVTTSVMATSKLGEVMQALKRKLDVGAKVFWVCPLVEESEKIDLAAAEDRFRDLQQQFGAAYHERIGLVHGRMRPKEKDAAMKAFIDGPVELLVATTVIEVGVDVTAATVMVIEHAERFGLAQLHQMRGRIGRGNEQSACLLLYQPPLGPTAKARLEVLRQTDDGFIIAEEDLKLRGAGELLGTRQSGVADFRLADLSRQGDLIAIADDDAKMILQSDPDLKTERGKALRQLLYLFERDVAVKYLRSG